MKQRLIWPVLLTSLAGGCALNAVRVEVAKDFSTASDQAVAKTGVYLNDVGERRRQANAALMASDPSCIPKLPLAGVGAFIRIRRPGGITPEMRKTNRVPLCLTDRERPTEANSFMLVLDDLGPKYLKPRFALLGAVADYSAALAKIVDRSKPELSKELTGIAAKIDDIGALLALAHATVPSATDALESGKGKAIIGLLQFAAELAQEQDQVVKIRQLDARDGTALDDGLDEIAEEITRFATLDRTSIDRLREARYTAYQAGRTKWDYNARYTAALVLIQQENEKTANLAAEQKMVGAIAELKQAHQELRALLQPDPQLTPAMRKRRNAIARDRLWRALDLIAGAATAFAGA